VKRPNNIEPSFNDEISIADIIHFFKSHKKMILICVIIGAILGCLFGNFSEPVYKGSAVFSPAKFSGAFIEKPKLTLRKLGLNSFYSKETFINCNTDFHKDIDYSIFSRVKASITQDGELIELRMQNKNKTVILNCLNAIITDINAAQNIIASPLIQAKNNELRILEEKLINAEKFEVEIINEKSKKYGQRKEDLIYKFILLSNRSDIKQALADTDRIKFELSSGHTKLAEIMLPIYIEKKSHFSPEFGTLLGLFFGLCLGILIALIKKLKISNF